MITATPTRTATYAGMGVSAGECIALSATPLKAWHPETRHAGMAADARFSTASSGTQKGVGCQSRSGQACSQQWVTRQQGGATQRQHTHASMAASVGGRIGLAHFSTRRTHVRGQRDDGEWNPTVDKKDKNHPHAHADTAADAGGRIGPARFTTRQTHERGYRKIGNLTEEKQAQGGRERESSIFASRRTPGAAVVGR